MKILRILLQKKSKVANHRWTQKTPRSLRALREIDNLFQGMADAVAKDKVQSQKDQVNNLARRCGEKRFLV